MPDAIFEQARLVEIYDLLDPDRSDLAVYAGLVAEFAASTVLDIGCGTGTFACLLAVAGVKVVAVDPAGASLDVARCKPGAAAVQWLHGDATSLPPLSVDLATMTGNVGQVFLTDEDLLETFRGVHDALRQGGRLVFEVRDPARQAWQDWSREQAHARVDVPGVGVVDRWLEITDVAGQLVSFRYTFRFGADGAVITSHSTLRFRERDEIEASLSLAKFRVLEVRDAPDRPGLELVFVAERSD
jgi:SAM-dependent methyltransferase